MTTIFKHRYTLTVLGEERIVEGLTLTELDYEITEGECLGSLKLDKVLAVSGRARILAACEELGNDGSFFDHLWEESD